MKKAAAQILSVQQRDVFEAVRLGQQSLSDGTPFDLAVDHGVAAALAAWSIDRGETIPGLWRDRLRQVRAQQLRQRSDLEDLRERLHASSVRWMTARGWARTVDPILPVRPMGDVDLYTTEDQLEALADALQPRWQLKHRSDDVWGTTRLFVDGEGRGPAVDVHLDFSLFGRRCPGAMEAALDRRRRVVDLWLPDAEDDWLIALIESLQSARQRSLRRHWERQGLGTRLGPIGRRVAMERFRLRPELLDQLEQRLHCSAPEGQALRWIAAGWLQASTSRVETLAWFARPGVAALWVRMRATCEGLFSSS